MALLIINCRSIIFILLIWFTYCTSERGCWCNKDEAGYSSNIPFICCEEIDNWCCECCYGLGGPLFFSVTYSYYSSIYNFNGIRGRHLASLIDLFFLFIIDFSICLISLYIGIYFTIFIIFILTFIFSLFSAICNFLALL